MRNKIFGYFALATFFFSSCSKKNTGELVGTGRDPYIHTDPYGMLFIPLGSFHMGPSDQDINYSMNSSSNKYSDSLCKFG